jgi:uncharacterized protein (TIGR02246 family)
MTSSSSSSSSTIPAGSDSAVRAVFVEVSRAWAEGDAEAFARCYADEATAILPGLLLPDRNAISTAMAPAFAGPLHGSRRVHELRGVRFLGDTTAIVISRSATVMPGEAEPPAQRWELATWVLSMQDGRWLIEAFHSCPEKAADQDAERDDVRER